MKRIVRKINPYPLVIGALLLLAIGLSLQGLQGLFVGLILSWAALGLRLLYTLRAEVRQLSALLLLQGGGDEGDGADADAHP